MRNFYISAISTVCLIVFISAFASAQGSASTQTPTSSKGSAPAQKKNDDIPGISLLAPVDEAEYIVGPGDGFILYMWGIKEEAIPLTVDPEGMIYIPRVGPFKVRGKSLKAVREELDEKLSELYHGVNFFLELSKPKIFKVKILGQVGAPGVYVVQSPVTVLEAVMKAEKVLDTGSSKGVQLRRGGEIAALVNLTKILNGDPEAENPFLEPGDEIYVPLNLRRVEVEGEVVRPGIYELGEGETLKDILLDAGGPTVRMNIEKVMVIRKRGVNDAEMIPVDMKALFFNEDMSKDIELKAGDKVSVAARADTVYVLGAVASPQGVPYASGYSILDYIGKCGGVTPSAAVKATAVLRGPVNNMQHIPVDLNLPLRGQSAANMPEIMPGDVIVIPTQSGLKFRDYISYIFTFKSLSAIFEDWFE
ncbi:MAG: SLBB domain-containing protein [bacterium]